MHPSPFRPFLRSFGRMLALAWTLPLSAHVDFLPAFSGAEGFGAVTAGGRGGAVIHVTNLNDDGPGSFRAALRAEGPRTVIFDVSGIIRLESELSVREPYLTIAGHTAPGDGVIIAGETVSLDTHDIVIRYLRLRRGETDEARRDDALGSDRTPGNIIIDHVSTSWGLDENISLYRNKQEPSLLPGGSTVLPARNITIQWTISSEALNPYDHAFGSTLGGAGANFHHMLWASNTGRNPSISFSFFVDFRNNVHFNWQHRSMDGAGPEAHVNVVNSYYKPGPATNGGSVRYRIVKPEIRDGVYEGGVGEWFVEGNVVEGYPAITADNWDGGVQPEQNFPLAWARTDTPHTAVTPPDDPDDPNDDDGAGAVVGTGNPLTIELPKIATEDASDAYATVLARSGATLPVRDAVDQRIVAMVASGEATAGPNGDGIIDDPSQVGGYPEIAEVLRPENDDRDRDGMPNSWEVAHGLDPDDAADRNVDFDNDGFTNLEEYLNELGAFAAVEPIRWTGALSDRYAEIGNWSIAFQPSRLDTVEVGVSETPIRIDAIAQDAGSLEIASGSELRIETDGQLRIAQSLVNRGNLRLIGDARLDLADDALLRNEGLLDLSGWKGSLPTNFENSGTLLLPSGLSIENTRAQGDTLFITAVTVPGSVYRLEANADLASESWSPYGAAITATAAETTFEISLATSNEQRFFRLVDTEGD